MFYHKNVKEANGKKDINQNFSGWGNYFIDGGNCKKAEQTLPIEYGSG
jgi:hypothetical protein